MTPTQQAVFGMGATVAVLLATFWTFINEPRPVAWFHDLQASIGSNTYYPQLTWILLLVLLFAPFAGILALLEKLRPAQDSSDGPPRSIPDRGARPGR